MVPTKAPIVYFQFLLPNTMKHPVTEWGRQLSYLLASKLKLALNLCKGIESCRGPNFWSLLKRGIYSLKLTEVAGGEGGRV